MKTIFKSKKLVLCLAMVLCVVASVFAFTAVPADAADVKVDDVYTFSSKTYYQLEKALPTFSSYTFETEFWIDPAVWGDGRAYNLIGNWADSGRSVRNV